MAGETIKTRGVCLAIHPWSRTSHIVSWLTAEGRVKTVVKGAVRPKSAFLGKYDLNYSCEILYYARAKGELHALRECSAVESRESLRGDFRRLAAADYLRHLMGELAPSGPDCESWLSELEASLDRIAHSENPRTLLAEIISSELRILSLSGLEPDFSGYDPDVEWSLFAVEQGVFNGGDGRTIRISPRTAQCLISPQNDCSMQILLDAARVIGVFYQFHLDCASDVRRMALRMISTTITRVVKNEQTQNIRRRDGGRHDDCRLQQE